MVFPRNLGLWSVNSFMLGDVGETLSLLWAISLPVPLNYSMMPDNLSNDMKKSLSKLEDVCSPGA